MKENLSIFVRILHMKSFEKEYACAKIIQVIENI